MNATDSLTAAIKASGLSANQIGKAAGVSPSVVSRFLAGSTMTLENADLVGAVVGWVGGSATVVLNKFARAKIKPVMYEGRILTGDDGDPYYEVDWGSEFKEPCHPAHAAVIRVARKELGLDDRRRWATPP